MIHFFPTFSRDAVSTPFGDALRESGVEHRIFAAAVAKHYRSRLGLLFRTIPALAGNAARSAIRSFGPGRRAPDTVVVGSDIEVLVFALARLLLLRRGPRIVLASFIFTLRGRPRLDAIRHAYVRFVLARTDLAVVHSRLEVERYADRFAGAGTRFAFIPWGTTITGLEAMIAEMRDLPGSGAVVAAGKSGRDYRTLFAAMAGVDAELRVICDYVGALPARPAGARVTVLTHCYYSDYFRELLQAAIVVIPLAVLDISAGQMVLIEAMGLGCAIIVTDTPTIRDYVADGEDAVLVPCGDVRALQAAMLRLLGDPALRLRLAANARAAYDAKYSTRRHIEQLLAAIAALG